MIEIENRSGQLVPESEIQKLLEFSIRELGLHPECELTLAFINDAEMEELHIKWMDLPGSTDVMSFPLYQHLLLYMFRPGSFLPEHLFPT